MESTIPEDEVLEDQEQDKLATLYGAGHPPTNGKYDHDCRSRFRCSRYPREWQSCTSPRWSPGCGLATDSQPRTASCWTSGA
eukprot:6417339-Pyramimonas_sp.AAC.2